MARLLLGLLRGQAFKCLLYLVDAGACIARMPAVLVLPPLAFTTTAAATTAPTLAARPTCCRSPSG